MGGYSFQCNLCGKWMVGGVKDHLKDKHGIKNLSPEQREQYNKVFHAEPPRADQA